MELEKKGQGRGVSPTIFTRARQDTIDELDAIAAGANMKRATLIRLILEQALRDGVKVTDPNAEPETPPYARKRNKRKAA